MVRPVPALQSPRSRSDSPVEPARRRLIVALDRDNMANRELVETLGDSVRFYKIGFISMLNEGGLELLQDLLARGNDIFLDLKIFDVPHTVKVTIGSIAKVKGIRFATVHGDQSIIDAAREGRGDSDLKILAVTALTHLTEESAREIYNFPSDVSLEEYVYKKTRQLVGYGCDGVIASPHEVATLREAFPERIILVAPAIRMPDDPADDQERIMGPRESIRRGADYLVVGRSIAHHEAPKMRAEDYVREIELGLEARG